MNGAIFDMDGLLFDTEKVFQETWRELAEENGHPLDEFFASRVCGVAHDLVEMILREYYPGQDPHYVQEECMKRVRRKLEKAVPVKEGSEEILKAFKDHGYRLAVASSTEIDQIRHNLSITGLLQYFDQVVSGQEVLNGKPHPDVFLLAAKRIGCKPEDCYVFEDSLSGVKAGVAAGSRTIMIPDLVPPTEEIRGIAYGIYPSLTEARKKLLPEE